MNCYIGIDIGTSTIKCLLISEEGELLACSKQRNVYYLDSSGMVEFNAEERYYSICSLIKTMLQNLPSTAQVLSLAIVGASGNTLLFNEYREPLGNAIGWQDMRAKSICTSPLFPFTREYIHAVCGWRMSSSFPLTHFAWMKQNQPWQYHAAEHYATDFVYYNYRLTGNWAMDRSTATNFYLVDQVQIEYHEPFINYLEIRKEGLPTLLKSGEAIGKITKQAAKDTGLQEDTMIIAGAFDHPASAIGTGMMHEGDLLISCGTSWVGFLPSKTREKLLQNDLLIDPFLSPDGLWGGMFSFTNVGDIISKYINLLFDNAENRYEQFEAAVNSIYGKRDEFPLDIMQTEISPENYLANMLCEHSVPEICLSILCSIADLMCNKIRYYENLGMPVNKVTLVGGFSIMHVWITILTKKLGLPVHRGEYGGYSGCFGAAILAGIGVGSYRDEYDGFEKMHLRSMFTTDI